MTALVGRLRFAAATGNDARVAQTMGTAVAVGALGYRWLHRRGLTTDEPKPMNLVGLVGGAVLFGAGMALSGYCPGTAAAAAGSGRREGVWAMAGMLAASAVFVATYPRLKKALEAGTLGRVTVAGGTPARAARHPWTSWSAPAPRTPVSTRFLDARPPRAGCQLHRTPVHR